MTTFLTGKEDGVVQSRRGEGHSSFLFTVGDYRSCPSSQTERGNGKTLKIHQHLCFIWPNCNEPALNSAPRLQEHHAAEELRWLQRKEEDTLAPVLFRLNNPKALGAKEAKRLRQECISSYKQRLSEKETQILERLEKVQHIHINTIITHC